jgi:hypothetical protein
MVAARLSSILGGTPLLVILDRGATERPETPAIISPSETGESFCPLFRLEVLRLSEFFDLLLDTEQKLPFRGGLLL